MARDGRILEANKALARRVGEPTWMHEAVAPGQVDVVTTLVASAGPSWHSVRAGLVADSGDPVDHRISAVEHRGHVLVLAEQLRAPEEKLNALLLELNDDLLRARRELAAQNRHLRELDELKSMFLASSTHDLRQPLTSLVGYAEMLDELDLPPQARRMATIIRRNARRMTVMINDLLGAATIMTGELRLDRRRTDVAALVRSAIEGIDPAARAGGVSLTCQGQGPAPAFVDAGRVLQVLDNLLSNAVKYCPGGGQVCVEYESRSGSVVIIVTDTGIGIPPSEQERLFERYFRASTASAHGIHGTGLGLANARAFAEAHGGTLTCTSEPGRGSSFALVLPEDVAPIGPPA